MDAAKSILCLAVLLRYLAAAYALYTVRIIGRGVDKLTRSGYGQIYREGSWRFICDHGWGDNDAMVFCRQLGYDRGVPFHILDKNRADPGQPIWRQEITCTGDESNLDQCSTRSVSKQCEPASVTCDKIDPELENGTLRLLDGPTPYSGRVDVSYRGLWGSICDRLWDETTAGVVCSMLGFNEGGLPVKHSVFGLARQVFLDAVRCTGGHETSIDQCMTRPYLDQFCKLQRTAGVICLQESVQNLTGQVRLTGGQYSTEGMVEISYYGIWGGICSETWQDTESRVVCRQLGYETGRKNAGKLRRTFQPSWLNYVHCRGNESTLLDCELSKWQYTPCDPERAIQVECFNKDLALLDPDYNRKTALILYATVPSILVLIAVIIIVTLMSRRQTVERPRVTENAVVHKGSQRSTRNPAYRLDLSFSAQPSSQYTPTRTPSGVYNYILDDDKDSTYLDLIDEKDEIKLAPRMHVPLPVPPRFDENNYLCPIAEVDGSSRPPAYKDGCHKPEEERFQSAELQRPPQ